MSQELFSRMFGRLASNASIRFLVRNNARTRLKSSHAIKEAVVRTTGYSFTRNGVTHSTAGVFWASGDPRNTVNVKADERPFTGAMLRSIIIAIEQAKSAGIRKLRVKTDLKLKSANYKELIETWRDRDFLMRNGQMMPNADLLEKLLDALDDNIQVDFEFTPAGKGGKNEVIEAIRAEKETGESRGEPVPDELAPTEPEPSTSTDTVPPPARKHPLPTVYVGARFEKSPRNEFRLASYATYWTPDTIAHIDVDKRPVGTTERLSIQPVTHFRAQLAGIIDALEEAINSGLTEVRIITDSLHFLHFYKIGWRKMDGEPVANEQQYERIRGLAAKLRVHFKAERLQLEDPTWQRVYELSEAGLHFPVRARDTREYGMSVHELLIGKDEIWSTEGTSTRRVRMYKRKKGCPAGIHWDRMDGVSLKGDEATASESCYDALDKKESVDVLCAVLEQANRFGLEQLVIRTNHTKLVHSTLGYLEIWRRSQWRDSRLKPIKDREKWERVAELQDKIDIVWDLIEDVDETKDLPYLERHRKKRGRKAKDKTIAVSAAANAAAS